MANRRFNGVRMPLLAGGRTLYGVALGIVMLDTRFPRFPADIGNAATWPFPVSYRVVRGAIPERLAQPEPDPTLLEPFLAAARELEADGVRAILTSCGFLAIYQRELAAAVNVPVFASPLLWVPLAAHTIGPDQSVGILTARLALTERHFAGAGFSTRDTSVVVVAPPAESHFVRTYVGNEPQADPDRLEQEIVDLAAGLLDDRPDVGAIVLECANFSPFAEAVRRRTGVPVYDLYALGMHACLVATGGRAPALEPVAVPRPAVSRLPA
jgi:hypothetical protein